MSAEPHIPERAHELAEAALNDLRVDRLLRPGRTRHVVTVALAAAAPVIVAQEFRSQVKKVVNEVGVHPELSGEAASAYEDGVLDAAAAFATRADELDPAGAES